MLNKVTIICYSDPVCTWCWGSEAVVRKLETHYRNRIGFKYVMAGLVEGIGRYYDAEHGIGGDANLSNKRIIAYWLESERRHGMPIESRGFALNSEEYPSTYPQNIAYKAAQIVSPDKADAFLRRIREATLAEAKVTGNPGVLVTLAFEIGLDVPRFIECFSDGRAEEAFRRDLAEAAEMGVVDIPTFSVACDGKMVLLRGYQPYEAFVSAISRVSDGDISPAGPARTDKALLRLLEKIPRLAAEEIKQAFDLGEEELDSWLKRLTMENTVKKTRAGRSFFVHRPGRETAMWEAGAGLDRRVER